MTNTAKIRIRLDHIPQTQKKEIRKTITQEVVEIKIKSHEIEGIKTKEQLDKPAKEENRKIQALMKIMAQTQDSNMMYQ